MFIIFREAPNGLSENEVIIYVFFMSISVAIKIVYALFTICVI